MKINKKQIVWAIIIAAISAIVIVFAVTSGDSVEETLDKSNSVDLVETENKGKAKEEEKEDKKEKEAVLPVFTYFVTAEDLADAKTKESIDALKKEYDKKITFKICNVDEDPALLENFPIVQDNTPALIMLNSEADITGILFKTNDIEKLKAEIDKVL